MPQNNALEPQEAIYLQPGVVLWQDQLDLQLLYPKRLFHTILSIKNVEDWVRMIMHVWSLKNPEWNLIEIIPWALTMYLQ